MLLNFCKQLRYFFSYVLRFTFYEICKLLRFTNCCAGFKFANSVRSMYQSLKPVQLFPAEKFVNAFDVSSSSRKRDSFKRRVIQNHSLSEPTHHLREFRDHLLRELLQLVAAQAAPIDFRVLQHQVDGVRHVHERALRKVCKAGVL